MNRERFISDFKQLSRQYSSDVLPEAMADYVKQNYLSKDLKGKPLDGTVHKDKVIGLVCQFYDRPLDVIISGGRKAKIITSKKCFVIYFGKEPR